MGAGANRQRGIMKIIAWTLLFAFSIWSFETTTFVPSAFAATSTSTSTSTNTGTSTTTKTSTSTTTNTNCTTSGQNLGGGNWTYCNNNTNNNQVNSEKDTKQLNDSGAQQSQMLGMMGIAMGMAMVAAGMAMQPPNMGLIMAGLLAIMMGMQALKAAAQMKKNANTAGYRGSNLTGLNPGPTVSNIGNGTGMSSNSDTGANGDSSGIKIDPALLRDGKANSIFTDFESKTGLNRDDLAASLAAGGNPLDMLANSPALAGKTSAGDLAKLMDSAKSSQGADSGNLMDKLGLTPEELAKMSGGEYTANLGGGGRTPNSTGASSFDFAGGAGATASDPNGGNANASKGNELGMSADVLAALSKNGVTDQTIFQMVSNQYKKKTPVLFGITQKRDGAKANPFETN